MNKIRYEKLDWWTTKHAYYIHEVADNQLVSMWFLHCRQNCNCRGLDAAFSLWCRDGDCDWVRTVVNYIFIVFDVAINFVKPDSNFLIICLFCFIYLSLCRSAFDSTQISIVLCLLSDHSANMLWFLCALIIRLCIHCLSLQTLLT